MPVSELCSRYTRTALRAVKRYQSRCTRAVLPRRPSSPPPVSGIIAREAHLQPRHPVDGEVYEGQRGVPLSCWSVVVLRLAHDHVPVRLVEVRVEAGLETESASGLRVEELLGESEGEDENEAAAGRPLRRHCT